MDDDDWDVDMNKVKELSKKYANEEFPLFMETIPDDIDSNRHVSALHCLLYDDHTPEERALSFKEQGNLHFQDALKTQEEKKKKRNKHLKDAEACYTEGIKQNCDNKELNSLLYSNRAHVHLLLGDYPKCITDSRSSLGLNPQNIKSYFRAAKASYYLYLLDQSETFCNEGLQQDATNTPLQALLNVIKQKKQEVYNKKKTFEENAARIQHLNDQTVQEVLKSRGIVVTPKKLYDLPLANQRAVWLDSEKILHWCCILLYPEYNVSEVIADFSEESSFRDHLAVMFPGDDSYAPWDTNRAYRNDNLAVYYDGGLTNNELYGVPMTVSLRVLLSNIGHVSHIPVFHVVVKSSFAEDHLKAYHTIKHSTFSIAKPC